MADENNQQQEQQQFALQRKAQLPTRGTSKDSSSSSSDDDGPEHSTTGLAICLARTLLNIDIPGTLWRRRGASKGCGKFALLESEHGVLLCLCSKRYGRSVIFFIPTRMVPPKSAPPDDVSPV
jgi:hypothetical protein